MNNKQLFGRRLALLRHHGFPDDSIGMLQELDIEGMSSEESDGETGERRVFKIKKLPWRSPDLTAFLHRIDDFPLKNTNNKVLRRRYVRRERLLKDIESDERPAVPGLNTNLYRSEWLQRQDKRGTSRLAVVDNVFELPKIDDFVK